MIIEPEKIKEWIAAREVESASITAEFNQKKAEMEAISASWNQYGQLAQLKLTRLEGRILELKELEQAVQAAAPPKSNEGPPA